jgi:hypothetical protein
VQLGLKNLTEISMENILLAITKNLCLVDTFNWSLITRQCVIKNFNFTIVNQSTCKIGNNRNNKKINVILVYFYAHSNASWAQFPLFNPFNPTSLMLLDAIPWVP